MTLLPSYQSIINKLKDRKIFLTCPEGTGEGKEGIISIKGKREGNEISLRGSDQIAKFATLISLVGCADGTVPAVAALQRCSLRSPQRKVVKERKTRIFKVESKSNSKFVIRRFGILENFAAAPNFGVAA